nr:hypothetical protein FEE99_12845 [Pseudomonas sp. ef1]
MIRGKATIFSAPQSLWERACPRRRRHIQLHHRLTQRFREQARSHNDPGQISSLCRTQIPVGASLLAKSPDQRHPRWMTHRFREQAELVK